MAAKKNALVMLMVLNQLLIISSAKAEEEPELKRTPRREVVKNDRLHFLAILPVYIVTVGSVIHEGSHAVVVWQSSQVLELCIWAAGLPLAVVPL